MFAHFSRFCAQISGFMSIKIAIFGSGSGTNAENIMQYFNGNLSIEVALVLSNKADAYILERARLHHIPYAVFTKTDFNNTVELLSLLKEHEVDFIVLAGFLLQIPVDLIHAYPNKIINIHPALLPKYGGKGMYGDRVHDAVIASGDKFSGITIHYIDEHYDSGSIIFQAKCDVLTTDTPNDLATRIHALEYKYFPKVIEDTICKEFKLSSE
ncbi:formyltetrahydrofolate-dependent phosphoribosylglycinamide formyltransferase [Bacteroides luti]|uniref:Phosphoribosylglycinamide formyltransferase n=2 Tax=Bacteroides luti TaxID=1297750 RepID=A0A1M4ZT29_9BACE|nr:formyltetrahydrofolate-dependent phosphoribosylglycinamide formyltransferase [Bacteroides luti]